MSDVSIRVENLSKQYRLGTVGTGTISHDLNRWWANIRGKEDPFLKIGETNDRSQAGNSDYVWSLKDINFEVKQGEVLGIIGKNGAGKSTLLKILSKVTGPTTGRVMAKGRIGALLEVGTGFHPELTGRENIFLNGAVLGMKKQEITGKLDEIVEFSGCARYVDTPVKRYSSGMKVRLAFAVAAFLEPEVLIVDEVLAVGDAEFQKKAIGKMQEVSKGEGRTVLFVSHNMLAVRQLCNRGLVLKNGQVAYQSDSNSAVDFYLSDSRNSLDDANVYLEDHMNRRAGRPVFFHSISTHSQGQLTNQIKIGNSIEFRIKLLGGVVLEKKFLKITIENTGGQRIATISNKYSDLYEFTSDFNNYDIKCEVSTMALLPGEYFVSVFLNDEKDPGDAIDNAFSFTIVDNLVSKSGALPHKGESLIYIPSQWSKIE
ncbi:polysaccharide ABC transporter ATP-binding protein [Roseivirga sp.]|uniref:ABC transporter ATP-binding protein n=1 Tax=Roseivirga sp. TaxID=1964215 RepID=UPI003B8C7DE9